MKLTLDERHIICGFSHMPESFYKEYFNKIKDIEQIEFISIARLNKEKMQIEIELNVGHSSCGKFLYSYRTGNVYHINDNSKSDSCSIEFIINQLILGIYKCYDKYNKDTFTLTQQRPHFEGGEIIPRLTLQLTNYLDNLKGHPDYSSLMK